MTQQPKVVIVNDRMQRGYRYMLTAPAGRNFDPQFRPDLTPKANFLQVGSLVQSSRPHVAIARSITSASMPASRCPSGVAMDGFTPTIREGGFSGTAATIWVAERPKRMRARSEDGRLCGGTSRRLSGTASHATRRADRANARHCCTGRTTAGRSDVDGANYSDPREN